MASLVVAEHNNSALDEATAKLFALATDLTEVFVVSVLEREKNQNG